MQQNGEENHAYLARTRPGSPCIAGRRACYRRTTCFHHLRVERPTTAPTTGERQFCVRFPRSTVEERTDNNTLGNSSRPFTRVRCSRAFNPEGDSAVLLHGLIHHRDCGRACELTHLSRPSKGGPACPLSATSGCEHSQHSNPLLDHLFGACEHRRRQIQSERPGSLQVNGQVELGRTLDR